YPLRIILIPVPSTPPHLYRACVAEDGTSAIRQDGQRSTSGSRPAEAVVLSASDRQQKSEVHLRALSRGPQHRLLQSRAARPEPAELGQIFLKDGSTLWRDHLLLTWDFRCSQGSQGVLAALQCREKSFTRSVLFRLDGADAKTGSRLPGLAYLDLARTIPCVVCFATVTTSVGTGRAIFRLVQDVDDKGKWKAVAVYTALQELRNTTEQRVGSVTAAKLGKLSRWPELVSGDAASSDCTALVVGGGHSGLFMAARLKEVGIRALVIERSAAVGDAWRRRYDGLVLHDTCYFNEFPYLKYPEGWPVYPSKDQFADFLTTYARTLQLPVWLDTELLATYWDEERRRWNISVRRGGQDYVLHPRYLIHAASVYGAPKMPTIPGINTFSGNRLVHSAQFISAGDCAGKDVVIVGTGTSAHDIASEYSGKGARVTMVQRSSTFVTSQRVIETLTGRNYNANTPSAEIADFEANSLPRPLQKRLMQQMTKHIANTTDKDLLVGLDKAGFALNLGLDEAGMVFQFLETASGVYMDVGASQLIIDGRIKVVRGEVAQVTERGVVLADGTSLPADDIVFATGYDDMDGYLRRLYGGAVADRLGRVGGLNEEGEMRNNPRTDVPRFFIVAGNVARSRLLSKQVALLIQAEEEGLLEEEGGKFIFPLHIPSTACMFVRLIVLTLGGRAVASQLIG
ncbi:hypothetical protein GE09DRAFT_1267106, partial [Coniochaeta sp. 2T2.1]